MNFYEQEMRQMFQGKPLLQDAKFTGRTMLAKLDDDLRVKLQFIATHISGQYNAILATVINRIDGEVDRQTFKFSDIIGMVQRQNLSPIAPHMWEYDGKASWYTPVNDLDKAAIAETVTNYLSMYRAEELAVPTQDQTPLYLYPASYARDNWQLEEYRASRNACLACKDAIESAISAHYQNNRMNPAAVSDVLEKFRPEQVAYVLACTVQHKDWDGRFSLDNKAWAKTVTTHKDRGSYGNDGTLQFVIDKSHPCLVDLFVTHLRKELEISKPSVRGSLAQRMQQPPTEKTPARKDPER